MANSLPSTNMSLPIPVVGVDPGPAWASDINSSLTLIDQHDHSPGKGIPVTPAGLNISTALPFNSNNATGLRSVRFTPQGSPLALAADLGCLYESGVDLYYNDGNGNQIQITASGSVAGSTGTITGLPSGTASAAFSAGTFTFNSATNTGANMSIASLLLRNNSAGSHVLTLSPPNSMSADFALVLPSLPGATNIMSLDSSGNIAAAINVDNSTLQLTSNTLAVKDAGITRPKLAALGQQLSSSCGSFSTGSSSATDVTNLSVTITTTGRPVFVGIVSDGTINTASLGALNSSGTGAAARFTIVRDATVVADCLVSQTGASANMTIFVPASSLWTIDVGASATSHTYKVQALTTTTLAFANNAKLIAYEIG